MKTYILSAILLAFGVQTSIQTSGQDSGQSSGRPSGQSNNFVLKGAIKGLDNGEIYLSYEQGDGKYVSDSAALQEGRFEFKGPLKEPVMAMLSSARQIRSYDDHNYTRLYLEPAEMTATGTAGDFKNMQVTGSATQDEYAALMEQEASIRKEEAPFSTAYNEANMTYIKAIRAKAPDPEQDSLKNKAQALHEKLDAYGERIEAIEMAYIRTHPDSYLAADHLRGYAAGLTLAELKGYYNGFSDRIRDSHYGTALRQEIKDLEQGSPGSMASMFSTKDINDQPFSLADYKGKKYVLVDFWASWCIPCRRSNPHLLSLYAKYGDKGLEIVGVSDDDNEPAAWKKAVAQDKTGVWKHVLRGLKMTKGGGFDTSSDISKPYGIHTLPTKILIDKDGMIIGRYGGGGQNDEAMDKKMEEVFK